MSLGPIQKELITGLKGLEMEEPLIMGILLMIDTEEKANEMVEWIVKNIETLTQEEALAQAIEISGKMKENDTH